MPLHSSATPLRCPASRPCTALHCLPQPRDPLCALPLPPAPRATGSALADSPPFPTAPQVGLGAALGYRQAPASRPLPYSPTISALAVPRRTPARPRPASLHCAPTPPRAAPLRSPKLRFSAAPRPVRLPPGRAVAERLRPVASSAQPPGPPHRRSLPGPASHRTAGRDAWPAQALWGHGSAPPPRPTPSSGGLRKKTLTAGSRRVQSGPSGRYPDRRPRSHAPALSHMARHPRGRHNPRGPGGAPTCRKVPAACYSSP